MSIEQMLDAGFALAFLALAVHIVRAINKPEVQKIYKKEIDKIRHL